MAVIVPTITAENAHVYREQVERVEEFAQRLHIDLMDGVFTPNKGVDPSTVWWPEGVQADVHLMFQNPLAALPELIQLKPTLIIIPAESECDFHEFSHQLAQQGIKAGLALLPDTQVSSIKETLQGFQHLLIFSGNLGYQGGSTADLSLLEKVEEAKAINPELEIAWDGGVNQENVAALIQAGIDILNVGGFIQTAEDPKVAFQALQTTALQV